MKKFKLIKRYPNSLELGTIVEKEWDEYGVQFAAYPEFWEEVLEPLFTTEDGVEILEGEEFYFVDSFWEIGKGKATVGCKKITLMKEFSTKEAAEKYIDENKPKFSIKDIENTLKESYKADFINSICRVKNKICNKFDL